MDHQVERDTQPGREVIQRAQSDVLVWIEGFASSMSSKSWQHVKQVLNMFNKFFVSDDSDSEVLEDVDKGHSIRKMTRS